MRLPIANIVTNIVLKADSERRQIHGPQQKVIQAALFPLASPSC